MKSRLCINCNQYHSRTYSASHLKNTSVYKFNQLFGKYEGHDSTINMTNESFKQSKYQIQKSRKKIIDQSFYQTKKILQRTIESSKRRMETLYQQSPFKKYLIYRQSQGKFVKKRHATEYTQEKLQKPLPQSNYQSVKKLKVDTPNKKILSKTSIMKIYDQQRKKSRTKVTISRQIDRLSALTSNNKNLQYSQVQIHKFYTQEPEEQKAHIYVDEQEQVSIKPITSQPLMQKQIQSHKSKIKQKKLVKIKKPSHYSTFFDNRCCGIQCDEYNNDLGEIVFDLQSFKKGQQDQYHQNQQFF